MGYLDLNIIPNVSVDYFNTLVSAARSMTDDLIINPDQRHAEMALIFLYGTAKDGDTVRILCGDMFREGKHSLKLKEKWERIIFNPEIRLEVIVAGGAEDKDSYRLSLLKEHKGDVLNNHIHELNINYYQKLIDSVETKSPFHFTIVGDKSYRFEYDIIKHKAYLNFNDKKAAVRLINQFEKLNKNKPTVSQEAAELV